MASVIPTTPFTLLYRCGHVRVFDVREITAKLVDLSGRKLRTVTSSDLEAVSSPRSEIDLGTFRVGEILALPTESDLRSGTKRVKWAPQEANAEETSELFDQQGKVSSSEDPLDGELRDRDVEEKVNGWWDMLDVEEYRASETEWDWTMEVMEMV
ncbi:MAG: hypothetical protein LQ352_007059 [Teloschistes flavicans]|nr:MAG: hypothetical protein LQ352_007059 [Teloschistes flavicans]